MDRGPLRFNIVRSVDRSGPDGPVLNFGPDRRSRFKVADRTWSGPARTFLRSICSPFRGRDYCGENIGLSENYLRYAF